MKVIPPIESHFSNTTKPNETPRTELLEQDVTLLFNENRELKKTIQNLQKEIEDYKQKYMKSQFRTNDLKRMLKNYQELILEDY